MVNEIDLPPLVVRTGKSEFRLRCHAAAWAAEYGGVARIDRRHARDCPGLLMLSATGPDTAAKAVLKGKQPLCRGTCGLEGGTKP